MREEYRILSTTAILGYGFPLASFEAGMARKPHLIAVDAGSTDPGPYYLGAGVSFTDRGAVKRDLTIMLTAAVAHQIPVVIGTAGGSGADAHLQWCRKIIEEIAHEENLHFPMAVIHAEIPRETVREALRAGQVKPLEPAPELTEALLDATGRIVGQMGLEPVMRALDGGAQVVLAGRAYDPVCFAAAAVRAGYDRGLAVHLGKILECASIAATPGSGSDCMFGYLGEDYFRLEPLNPIRQCTPRSVAAHTLYEKTNPYILPGPGGSLDLTDATFTAYTDRIAEVRGSKFVPGEKYTIKLEGARRIGYRTVSIAGTRDPIMMREIDSITQAVRERVQDNFREAAMDYTLHFIIYGRDGVMGQLEPTPVIDGHELGIVIEAVADTQAHADTICAFARSTMLHYGYEGRRATAGNLAFPYSPSDFHAGEVYVFSLYHIIEVEDPCALFPIEFQEVNP
ncbi:MAG: DUF1446 domain-containing protein [Oscillospiraceae bacterium]|jgi:hypothetical protein|nr:DUF1446 domain-containing protein [Oscillospiraceae bacterium]